MKITLDVPECEGGEGRTDRLGKAEIGDLEKAKFDLVVLDDADKSS